MLYLCHCKFISMCLCLNSVWTERKVACLPFHYVSPPSAKWEWRFVKRTNLPSCSKSAVLVRWHHCGSLSLVKTVDNDKQISCFYLKGCFVNNVFVGSHRSFWNLSITLKNQSFGETRKLGHIFCLVSLLGKYSNENNDKTMTEYLLRGVYIIWFCKQSWTKHTLTAFRWQWQSIIVSRLPSVCWCSKSFKTSSTKRHLWFGHH